jgi:hypothetical protein
MMIKNNGVANVSKIAIINPYLQGGHTQTAEMESIARFRQAAKARSIDTEVFAGTQGLEEYDPDFVINKTYQEGKLSKYPTYLHLVIPFGLIKDVPRFVRNIMTYDGYLIASPSIVDWLNQLCLLHNKKPQICEGYFSVPKTEFKSCDFKKATAMYMGTNWDGLRHKDLFNLLADGAYLKCYGPKSSWSQYPNSLYMGEIPFDGLSALSFYNSHGIGLCFGMQECDDGNIANNRLFEVPASSAVAICARNEWNKSMYGDAVLYINRNIPTAELAEQIIFNVNWVRSNPAKAQEMTKGAHELFCSKFSMEYYLEQTLAMHQRVLTQKKYLPQVELIAATKTYHIPTVNAQPKIGYLVTIDNIDSNIETLFNDLQQQTYQNIVVIVLASNEHFEKRLTTQYGRKLNLLFIPYFGVASNQELFKLLSDNHITWIGVLNAQDRLFPNHSGVLIDAYQSSNEVKVVGVFSGSLETSDSLFLPDSMTDIHDLKNRNKSRVGQVIFNTNISLHSVLINLAQTGLEIFQDINFYRLKAKSIASQLENRGTIIPTGEVTCATQAQHDQEVANNLNQLKEELASTIKTLYQMGDVIRRMGDEILELKTTQNWLLNEDASIHQGRVMRFLGKCERRISYLKARLLKLKIFKQQA